MLLCNQMLGCLLVLESTKKNQFTLRNMGVRAQPLSHQSTILADLTISHQISHLDQSKSRSQKCQTSFSLKRDVIRKIWGYTHARGTNVMGHIFSHELLTRMEHLAKINFCITFVTSNVTTNEHAVRKCHGLGQEFLC